jgi:hypothetical protein
MTPKQELKAALDRWDVIMGTSNSSDNFAGVFEVVEEIIDAGEGLRNCREWSLNSFNKVRNSLIEELGQAEICSLPSNCHNTAEYIDKVLLPLIFGERQINVEHGASDKESPSGSPIDNKPSPGAPHHHDLQVTKVNCSICGIDMTEHHHLHPSDVSNMPIDEVGP